MFSLTNFGITYEEIQDILHYITDEFPDLNYWVDNSLQSSLIEHDINSFVIIFSENGDNLHDLGVLYYLEPKIWKLIEDVDSQLRAYDLYVAASDFGSSDIYYELVISKVGHEPKLLTRYGKTLENSTATATTAGSGAVTNPSVSSASTSASSPGSGDRTFTLSGKSKQKIGNPSQVSDLRFLGKVKIKRVKDF